MKILDLGSPEQTLQERVPAEDFYHLARISAKAALEMGRELYFRTPPGHVPDEHAQIILACAFAMKTEANAAVFVRPDNATSAEQVGARLGSVPITTLAYLNAMQESRRLTPRLVNECVWDQVVGEEAASA